MADATYFGKIDHTGSLLFLTVPNGSYRFCDRPNGLLPTRTAANPHMVMRGAHGEMGHAKMTPHRFKGSGILLFSQNYWSRYTSTKKEQIQGEIRFREILGRPYCGFDTVG